MRHKFKILIVQLKDKYLQIKVSKYYKIDQKIGKIFFVGNLLIQGAHKERF